jgi:hypothetical protein
MTWPGRDCLSAVSVCLDLPQPASETCLLIARATGGDGLGARVSVASMPWPEPRLRGWVEPPRAGVSLWDSTRGQNSFARVLHAEVAPTGSEASRLTGSIAPRAPRSLVLVILGFAAVMLSVAMAFGVVSAVTGGSLGPLLVALGAAVFLVVFMRFGCAAYRADAHRLQAAICEIVQAQSER